MNKWTYTTLGKISEIITGPFGSQLHQSDYVEQGIPVVMPQDIDNRKVNYASINYVSNEDSIRLERYKTIINDILYARRGDVEKHAFIKEKDNGVLCGTGCLRVRITTSEVEPEFISFFLNREETRKWLAAHAVGTNMPNLNTDILSDVPIAYPLLEEQRKIVQVLNSFDEKIALNSAVNDNLQQQAILLYDYWFTQFDFPDANGKPYYSSGNKMTWNNQLKKNIPLSWKVKPLKAICEICLGGTPSTTVSKYWNGSISWLNSGEIAQFPVVSSEKKITQLGLENSPTKLMSKNTTVISITGNIRASILALDACANQSVVGILENEIFKSPFIYQNMLRLLKHYTSISTGNCQKHISKGAIEESLVCIPDNIVLKQYYSLSEPIYKQMHEIALENQHLTELRDWLLPMLMNGQVTIKD